MGKTRLQLVNFNKGLITEANPLIQPLGSTRSEQNFTLENDGKRNRRLGMDYEVGGVERGVTVVDTALIDAATNTYRWDVTGDVNGLYFIVTQIGNKISFFESTEEPLSTAWESTITLTNDPTDKVYSITQVNSLLVIATGVSIWTITYVDGALNPFELEEATLEVRDFFGIEDIDLLTGKRLDRGNDLKYRPPTPQGTTQGAVGDYTTPEHFYNLFNQGWPTRNILTLSGGFKAVRDYMHRCVADNLFIPSNADTYTEFVVSSTDVVPREAEAFTPSTMRSGTIRTFASPKGRAILELLSRGKSRGEVYDEGFLSSKPAFTPAQDITPGSASAVAEFAGRVFYAGFSGQVIDGDDRSPKLNNYVCFSQLIEFRQQASQCYQVADPTSSEDSEVVATDGGIIRISGATNITGLQQAANSLLVFAENGVWQILGGGDYGFAADTYQVIKVSERGCVAPETIVNVNESVMYWAVDGIYLCESSDSGLFVARDMTTVSIKSFYNSIVGKQLAYGRYDDFTKSVNWVFGDGTELSFKTAFNAWVVNEIADSDVKVRGLVEVNPFVGGKRIDPITVDAVVVTVDGEDVVVATGIKLDSDTETKYLVIRPDNNTFTFASYNNTNFTDWEGVSTFGTDANAFMQGAHFTGGSGATSKQSPYVTFHFNKTEDGFDAEYEATNQSSCLIQTSWDWSNSDNSNKQGREFQAYRFRRHYIPADNTDGFDNGYEIVVTKNKVRGRGKALSVLIKTEALKNCQLIGWEQEITSNE